MPYIGKSPSVGLRTRYNYTATAGQTSFSGADNSNVTLTYTDTNYTDVYLNGVMLKAVTDYASTTGTSIVLVSGAAVDDILEVVVYDAFSVADTVSAVDGGAFASNVSFGADISSSTLGTSNFRAGVNAGNSIESGGNYNVVVGDEAGTAITTGDDNVAIGFEALKAEDTTKGATAVGYRALLQQNLGSDGYNVAVGHSAGISNTTGVSNTFIGGFSAGSATVTGASNTAVGRNSLYALTSGTQNVAIGALAGDAITTGSYNVALGKSALENNTTASNNTAVGHQAGYANTTGADNVAVGYLSLSTETGGQNNVAVGRSALENQVNSSGNIYNTAVGAKAGRQITTGIENVLIGGLAGDALTDADFNIAIGVESLGSDTRGSKSVAIGGGALNAQNFTSATDTHNIAIGFHAGNDITTGVKNTIVGGIAGDNITTGIENVVVGYNSMNATTGDSNIIVGSNSSNSSTTVNTEYVIGRAASGSGTNTFTIGRGDTDVQINLDGSDTSWSATSDERLKHNINPLSVGLDFIDELRPVTYEWKEKKDIDPSLGRYYEENSTEPCRGDGGIHYGLIAQEVKTVIDKYSLTGRHNIWKEGVGGFQVVGLGNVMPMLIKAVQELSAKNDALESKNDALEARITALEA